MTQNYILPEDQREQFLANVKRLAEQAREEDLGAGDMTSMIISEPGRGTFRLVSKQAGIFSGQEIVETVLSVYLKDFEVRWLEDVEDGIRMDDPPYHLMEILGPTQQVLGAERVLLNFLQRLSGVATTTRKYVDAIAGTGVEILDTRKTTPGWRLLEKYAVRCGGAKNHRMGLYDAILLKDNHLARYPVERLAAGVFEMLNKIDSLDRTPDFVEVEADTLEQVEQLLSVVGIDRIMLDNFDLMDMRQAVKMRNEQNPRKTVKLEASGGVTLRRIKEIAETGVDYISVGSLTHSATAIDMSLERIS